VIVAFKAIIALSLLAFLEASPAVQSSAPTAPTSAPLAQPSATAPVTVQDVLGRMVANREGLNSFTVPIAFSISVHEIVSVSISPTGIRYFQRPDQEALIMHKVPGPAKSFQRIFAGLGTPETWPSQYQISLVTPDLASGNGIYELRGVPNKGGSVDHILLDVSQTTYEPVKARWFYKNGATIVMSIVNAMAGDKYLLPKTETLDIHFPSYKAHAVANYGEYSINTPIPDSVWQQQSTK